MNHTLRRLLTLAGVAAVPVLVLCVFFVLPVSGMLAEGLWPDGTFDPGGIAEVLARPRVHRVLWFTIWSAAVGTLLTVLLGVPAAHVLYRLRFPGQRVLRAALLIPFVLPTVVVGVAFRQVLGAGGPLAGLGLDGTPAAIIAALAFFNLAVVVRTVGSAWESLDDLADPAYKNDLVVPGAPTSSPGMAFLLSTIAEYGEDGWQDYWSRLMDNGAKLTSGWDDAYFVDFTGGAEKGTRPIVVSYDTSPAFTVDKKTGRSTTGALLDTCFRQVEYAGVLANAKNPEGAQQVVDFLLSNEVQAALPDSMYVYPVSEDVTLPTDWATFATSPETPYSVDPATIAAKRKDWLTEWTDVTSR